MKKKMYLKVRMTVSNNNGRVVFAANTELIKSVIQRLLKQSVEIQPSQVFLVYHWSVSGWDNWRCVYGCERCANPQRPQAQCRGCKCVVRSAQCRDTLQDTPQTTPAAATAHRSDTVADASKTFMTDTWLGVSDLLFGTVSIVFETASK